MDNFTIKVEDSNDTDEGILLNIEKQEVENKNIAIYLKVAKTEGASEEKPPRKEQSTDDDINSSFETIFLPEVYQGVAMETPFFDFNRYKKICGLPTEDYEIKPNVADYVSVYNSENVQLLSTEGSQETSENDIHSSISNSFLHCHALSQNSNFKQMPEWNSRIPMNNLHVNYNIYQPVHYMNTCPEKNIPRCNSRVMEDSGNSSVHSPPGRRKIDITEEDDDVIIIEDNTEVICHSEDNNRYSDKFEDIYNVKLHKKFNNDGSRVNKQMPDDETDEEAKYKCPLCKRPRMFYTLTAVNNHLKFEHISLFRNNGGKPRSSISPENSKQISSQVNKLHTT